RKRVEVNREQSIWDRFYRRVKYELSKARFAQTFIDAYEPTTGGWRNSAQKRIRPESELIRAKHKLALCKVRMRKTIAQLSATSLSPPPGSKRPVSTSPSVSGVTSSTPGEKKRSVTVSNADEKKRPDSVSTIDEKKPTVTGTVTEEEKRNVSLLGIAVTLSGEQKRAVSVSDDDRERAVSVSEDDGELAVSGLEGKRVVLPLPPSGEDEEASEVQMEEEIDTNGCIVCGLVETSEGLLACQCINCGLIMHSECIWGEEDPPFPAGPEFLCSKCYILDECLEEINLSFGTHYTKWEDLFPDIDDEGFEIVRPRQSAKYAISIADPNPNLHPNSEVLGELSTISNLPKNELDSEGEPWEPPVLDENTGKNTDSDDSRSSSGSDSDEDEDEEKEDDDEPEQPIDQQEGRPRRRRRAGPKAEDWRRIIEMERGILPFEEALAMEGFDDREDAYAEWWKFAEGDESSDIRDYQPNSDHVSETPSEEYSWETCSTSDEDEDEDESESSDNSIYVRKHRLRKAKSAAVKEVKSATLRINQLEKLGELNLSDEEDELDSDYEVEETDAESDGSDGDDDMDETSPKRESRDGSKVPRRGRKMRDKTGTEKAKIEEETEPEELARNNSGKPAEMCGVDSEESGKSREGSGKFVRKLEVLRSSEEKKKEPEKDIEYDNRYNLGGWRSRNIKSSEEEISIISKGEESTAHKPGPYPPSSLSNIPSPPRKVLENSETQARPTDMSSTNVNTDLSSTNVNQSQSSIAFEPSNSSGKRKEGKTTRSYKMWSEVEIRILAECYRHMIEKTGLSFGGRKRARPNYKKIQERLSEATGNPPVPISKIRDKFRRIRIEIEKHGNSDLPGRGKKNKGEENKLQKESYEFSRDGVSVESKEEGADRKIDELPFGTYELNQDGKSVRQRGSRGVGNITPNLNHRNRNRRFQVDETWRKAEQLKLPEEEIFDHIDANSDGKFDDVDLCCFAVSQGVYLTREEVIELVHSVPGGESGDIQLKPFIRTLRDSQHKLSVFIRKTALGRELLGFQSSHDQDDRW
ncbi:hypothetical protein AAMO2058_001276500, partial [Amorphochlora amoebiformis]